MSKSIFVAVLASCAALAAPGDQALASFNGACKTSKSKYLVVETATNTTSQTPVRVPSSKVSFTTSAAGCVIVQFAAQASSSLNNWMYVNAVIDDNADAVPVSNPFSSNDNAVDRATLFVFPTVSAGNHHVQMTFQSSNGTNVGLGTRTIVIQYQ